AALPPKSGFPVSTDPVSVGPRLAATCGSSTKIRLSGLHRPCVGGTTTGSYVRLFHQNPAFRSPPTLCRWDHDWKLSALRSLPGRHPALGVAEDVVGLA